MNTPENDKDLSLVDGLSARIDSQMQAAEKTLDGLAQNAAEYVHRGSHAVEKGAQDLRRQVLHMREASQIYIHNQPLRAVLYAAAAGAALVMLSRLLTRGPR